MCVLEALPKGCCLGEKEIAVMQIFLLAAFSDQVIKKKISLMPLSLPQLCVGLCTTLQNYSSLVYRSCA